MKGAFKLSILLVFMLSAFAFKADEAIQNHEIVVTKSITAISENVYQVTIKINNGDQVNGIAKYETKLPLAADFVKEISKDKALSMKLDGRKIKLLWLHIQKNRTYTSSFQISTKKSVEDIMMEGKVFGHVNGERFSFEEKGKFITF